MSQEMNNPNASGQGQDPQKPASTYNPSTGGSPSPKKSNTWIYGGIIALLLGTNIFLLMNRNKISDERQEAISQRDSVASSRDMLNNEYQAALTRMDQLVTSNNQLSNEIKDKDGELQKLRSELQNIMSKSRKTANEITRAKQLIAQLNDKVTSYESRIAELEGKNQELTNENQGLTQQNQEMSERNAGLQQKVKLGAVLHASNIRLEAINLKRNGTKEKETSRARRTDLLRVIFDIDENRIAESGTKELFLRITGPDGRLLSNAAYGSGVTTTDDGQQLSYTLSKQISLATNTPVKDVKVDWSQDNDFQRGTYVIDIYNAGLRIGGGSVELR